MLEGKKVKKASTVLEGYPLNEHDCIGAVLVVGDLIAHAGLAERGVLVFCCVVSTYYYYDL